jgi:BirA family transcriptional regulator, biotin operon repressor / biotin---[acetyl-CoA-carboxylase] ligase
VALSTTLAEPGGTQWRDVAVLPETPSTNAVVSARARAGEPAGLVIVTEHQTAGRGRLDRVWVTPPRAALTFSLLVRPDAVPAARWPWLPLLTGLAVVEGVRRATGLEATLKWPNDVLVDDAKVAGILVERVESPAGAAAVVGVGLNVSSTRDELPVATATSLVLAGAASPDRTRILAEVLSAFGRRYDGWTAVGGDAGRGLHAAYVAECSTVGREVRVELPGGSALSGRAVGVDPDGRLEVAAGGRVQSLGAGDVVHVRPA